MRAIVDDQPSTNGLAHVPADERVESVLLTIADGPTLARKKDVTR
ncbi:hypothetical protein LCL61_18035 [Amycolatopsis coloradensis]|uniref:Uncharacterized protein n=1 Tax=Amycolatopsis coloradensis TaxID=76021 RepID=A0ACD5BIC3_9PSEU